MQYRKLGSSDLEVSVIGLGTNNFGNPDRPGAPRRFGIRDKAQSVAVLNKCLDVGINFIDTADVYGGGRSEVHIGDFLKSHRKEIILATKFNIANLEGESIKDRVNRSIDSSLAALQTDYIDLYQLHFPNADLLQEEILGPMNDLVTAGKVRYLGECNYSGWRHAHADAISERNGWARMVSSQNYYNVFRRQVELELLPFCTAQNVGFLPYFPLAGGWLTGKYKPTDVPNADSRRMVTSLQTDAAARETLNKLEAYAAEGGHSLLELAFSWLLAHPAVSSVIAGAMTPDQVAANAVSGDWVMTDEERDAIDAIASWDGTSEEIETYSPGSPPIRRR
ncbi:MAG: putative oxidoreductase [Chloroflexi bacterium]|jgi:aryl-alcohol dehydrogenase-like predicted oxidoreductase|nr:MAG: putative oxidoreductase [Chloroflexota bacterium]